MVKKIISSFISLFVLMALIVISSIFIARSFLSGSNLMSLVDSELAKENIEITDIFSEEYEGIEKYIDKKELKSEIGNLMSDYIKYSSGVPNAKKPNTDKISKLLNESVKKYEEKTKNEVDNTIIDNFLEDFEDSFIKKNDNEPIEENVAKIFKVIYSDSILTIFIVTIVVGLLLIIFINKSIISLAKYIAGITILNGGLIMFLGKAISSIDLSTSKESIDNAMLDNIFALFSQISFVFLGIGIVIIITLIIIKIIMKNKTLPKNNLESDQNKNEENL